MGLRRILCDVSRKSKTVVNIGSRYTIAYFSACIHYISCHAEDQAEIVYVPIHKMPVYMLVFSYYLVYKPKYEYFRFSDDDHIINGYVSQYLR